MSRRRRRLGNKTAPRNSSGLFFTPSLTGIDKWYMIFARFQLCARHSRASRMAVQNSSISSTVV